VGVSCWQVQHYTVRDARATPVRIASASFGGTALPTCKNRLPLVPRHGYPSGNDWRRAASSTVTRTDDPSGATHSVPDGWLPLPCARIVNDGVSIGLGSRAAPGPEF